MSHGVISGISVTFTCIRCGDPGELPATLTSYSVSNPVQPIYSGSTGQAVHYYSMGGSTVTGTFTVFMQPYHCPNCVILLERFKQLKERIGV
jgi:hypothetical protein